MSVCKTYVSNKELTNTFSNKNRLMTKVPLNFGTLIIYIFIYSYIHVPHSLVHIDRIKELYFSDVNKQRPDALLTMNH